MTRPRTARLFLKIPRLFRVPTNILLSSLPPHNDNDDHYRTGPPLPSPGSKSNAVLFLRPLWPRAVAICDALRHCHMFRTYPNKEIRCSIRLNCATKLAGKKKNSRV